MQAPLRKKQAEFNLAMRYYERASFYQYFNYLISTLNVGMQIGGLLWIFYSELPIALHFLLIILSFFLADFINGFVHLLMDHAQNYRPPFGPFVANFHLHHHRPIYKRRSPFAVYFFESGSKVWLVPLLLSTHLLFYFSHTHSLTIVGSFLIYFSIWSSIAELSHYLCHSVDTKLVRFLGRCGLLLSKKHHYQHHLKDNCNYAFLNGSSDPLLNLIAAKFFTGYKQNSDLHYARFKTHKMR